MSSSVGHKVYCILAYMTSEQSCIACTLSTIFALISSIYVVVEVDLIWDKLVSSSNIVLGDKRPYSLVAFITSLIDNSFSGAKKSDISNTPYFCK